MTWLQWLQLDCSSAAARLQLGCLECPQVALLLCSPGFARAWKKRKHSTHSTHTKSRRVPLDKKVSKHVNVIMEASMTTRHKFGWHNYAAHLRIPYEKSSTSNADHFSRCRLQNAKPDGHLMHAMPYLNDSWSGSNWRKPAFSFLKWLPRCFQPLGRYQSLERKSKPECHKISFGGIPDSRNVLLYFTNLSEACCKAKRWVSMK